MKKLSSTLHLGRDEWLRLRKNGIGGSDAGAVCGVNEYVSPIAVYQDKTTDEISDFDNEAMRQGRELEEYVARRFSEESGLKVHRANAIYYDPDHPFMLADPDRIISGTGMRIGLECKTVSPYSSSKWENGNIPPSYLAQVYHYMSVFNADYWYIAAIVYGKDFIIRKIGRDDSAIQDLRTIEEDFWKNNVEARVMPSPDGSGVSDKLISRLYSKANPGSRIELTGFREKLIRRQELVTVIDRIPYKNKDHYECQFQVGYKGLIELAYRNPIVQTISAEVVYENDEFHYELGLDAKLVHRPTLNNRGEIKAFYGLFRLNGGGFGFSVMSREEMDDYARQYSKAFDSSFSPWKTNYIAMAKKTVIKQALKYAPIKADLQKALISDSTVKSHIDEDMTSVMPEIIQDPEAEGA